MKITDYKTATGDSWSALDKEVNKLLALGYHLYGNPYVVQSKTELAISSFVVAQGMVKTGLQDKPHPMDTAHGTVIAPT